MPMTPKIENFGRSKRHSSKEHPASVSVLHLRDVGFKIRTFYFLLESTPQSVAFVPSLFASLMLLVDLLHVISLLFDRGFEPQTSLFCCPMTSRTIGSGFGIVIP